MLIFPIPLSKKDTKIFYQQMGKFIFLFVVIDVSFAIILTVLNFILTRDIVSEEITVFSIGAGLFFSVFFAIIPALIVAIVIKVVISLIKKRKQIASNYYQVFPSRYFCYFFPIHNME